MKQIIFANKLGAVFFFNVNTNIKKRIIKNRKKCMEIILLIKFLILKRFLFSLLAKYVF